MVVVVEVVVVVVVACLLRLAAEIAKCGQQKKTNYFEYHNQ